jgi:hypothetical protein
MQTFVKFEKPAMFDLSDRRTGLNDIRKSDGESPFNTLTAASGEVFQILYGRACKLSPDLPHYDYIKPVCFAYRSTRF